MHTQIEMQSPHKIQGLSQLLWKFTAICLLTTLIVYRFFKIKGEKRCLDYPISKVNTKKNPGSALAFSKKDQSAIHNVAFWGLSI